MMIAKWVLSLSRYPVKALFDSQIKGSLLIVNEDITLRFFHDHKTYFTAAAVILQLLETLVDEQVLTSSCPFSVLWDLLISI